MEYRYIYIILTLINVLISFKRYDYLKKSYIDITDPIFCWHITWSVVFFVRIFYNPNYNYILNHYFLEFISYYISFTCGLWLVHYIYKNKIVNKDTIITYNEMFVNYVVFLLIISIIDIISIYLFYKIIQSGYPISSLIIDRSFHSYFEEEKRLVILTALGSLNIVLILFYDYLYCISVIRYFITTFISIIPFIIVSIITAGRTALVLPILLSMIFYFKRRNINKIERKLAFIASIIIIICIVIFLFYDAARRNNRITMPNIENINNMVCYFTEPLDSYEYHKIDIYNVLRSYPGYYTFNFLVRNISKIINVKYGPNESFFSLMPETVLYDDVLYVSVGTMFLEFDFDYGNGFGHIVVFMIAFLFNYINYKYKNSNYVIYIVTGLFTFQVLWSGQIYYLTNNSAFYFIIISSIIAQLYIMIKYKNINQKIIENKKNEKRVKTISTESYLEK